MNTSEVKVNRINLVHALHPLEVAAKGKNPPQLIIYSQSGSLYLQIGGAFAHVPCEGNLSAQGRISGKLARNIRQFLPQEPIITITQQPEAICFGNWKISCEWETQLERIIKIPINASIGHILGIWQRYSDEEIEKSGLLHVFQKADEERQKRIEQALNLLKPLGVTHEDITTLVDQALIRMNQGNFDE